MLFSRRDSWRWQNGDAGDGERLPGIPALGDVDPADPLASRLALAAVLRSRPWLR